MSEEPTKFEIIYKDGKVIVETIHLPTGTFFFVSFENESPLLLTKAKNSKRKTWTSIPKARRKEAEEVGALICEYISRNNPG